MRSYEKNVSGKSDYYIYTASAVAKKIFFYPLHTGYFYYEPGYYLKRDNFNSFLMLLVTKGSCELKIKEGVFTVPQGSIALVDCYAPHEYGSAHSWEASWLHFDGLLARDYYEYITQTNGNIIIPQNLQTTEHTLGKLCDIFRNSTPIREASMSKYIVTLLTELLLSGSKENISSRNAAALEDTISYINEHFADPLTLEDLAQKAALSIYHFTRVFTSETGMTPHQYLIATRLNSARFLLKSTDISIKEIAFNTGFASESSFCSTFKKWEKATPTEYRNFASV